MHKSSQKILQEVNEFYQAHPFPGFDSGKYSYRDDLHRKASWFGRLIDEQIPYDATIIDVGCGTGQLACFLALKGRQVLGVDYSQLSLEKANELRRRLRLETVTFARMNMLEIAFADESFDYTLCLGVLHHTSNPCRGFENLARITRPNGYIVLGLYNPIGRFPVKMRRVMKRISSQSRIQEEAVRRQLVINDKDVEKTESWLADQYYHPHESTHMAGQVLAWFSTNGIEYANSIPPIEWFRAMKKNTKVFSQAKVAAWRRGSLPRFMAQLKWLMSLRDNGGYFTVVGRKKCTS